MQNLTINKLVCNSHCGNGLPCDVCCTRWPPVEFSPGGRSTNLSTFTHHFPVAFRYLLPRVVGCPPRPWPSKENSLGGFCTEPEGMGKCMENVCIQVKINTPPFFIQLLNWEFIIQCHFVEIAMILLILRSIMFFFKLIMMFLVLKM